MHQGLITDRAIASLNSYKNSARPNVSLFKFTPFSYKHEPHLHPLSFVFLCKNHKSHSSHRITTSRHCLSVVVQHFTPPNSACHSSPFIHPPSESPSPSTSLDGLTFVVVDSRLPSSLYSPQPPTSIASVPHPPPFCL
ncbi:hypothetical protein PIB30_029351 [Stylosanthes scabra]|uniref:Uncharacterized protein n=1 Tax=Stylosanthes scabra TaxID=79078 RepID=A0ABU6SBF2_9FABA|nr:hypothetical protein [Stylosanthes scabra]